jgi:predicted DCC family thiol-disulfide oxidoreductase YuxK
MGCDRSCALDDILKSGQPLIFGATDAMETQLRNRSMTSNVDIEVFYDGGCPLCRREISMLRRRDHAQRIRFTDIDAPGFSPDSVGRTREELMARLHARLPDGTWIWGVEVFRRLYAAAGFQRLARLSRWPVISQLLELAYRVFARNRLRLTGRCSAESCPTRPQTTDKAGVTHS